MLSLAGTFSAHSTRSVSSSAAAGAGIALSDIIEAADWSRESTFKRFYHKPTHNNNFAHAVINS